LNVAVFAVDLFAKREFKKVNEFLDRNICVRLVALWTRPGFELVPDDAVADLCFELRVLVLLDDLVLADHLHRSLEPLLCGVCFVLDCLAWICCSIF